MIERGGGENEVSASFEVRGSVVRGQGRGARLLGFPTANLDAKACAKVLERVPLGVYYGSCELRGTHYDMVMNVGWSPFFGNAEKTMEVHLLHDFGEEEFYGEALCVWVEGYVRPELDFDNVEALKEAIAGDVEWARRQQRRNKRKK